MSIVNDTTDPFAGLGEDWRTTQPALIPSECAAAEGAASWLARPSSASPDDLAAVAEMAPMNDVADEDRWSEADDFTDDAAAIRFRATARTPCATALTLTRGWSWRNRHPAARQPPEAFGGVGRRAEVCSACRDVGTPGRASGGGLRHVSRRACCEPTSRPGQRGSKRWSDAVDAQAGGQPP